MKKQLHGRILFIVGILAIIVSSLTVIDLGINIVSFLIDNSFNINQLLQNNFIDLTIELVFAIMEISAGINIIKYINKNEHFDVYSTIPKLIRSIITPFFLFIITDIIFYILMSDSFNITPNALLSIVLFIIISVTSSNTRSAITKKEIDSLNAIICILSISSLCYILISFNTIFILSEGIINLVVNILNTINILMIIIFSIVSIIYYKKHPELKELDSLENVDYEIIKEDENMQVIKIYHQRAKNKSMNNFIKALNIIIGSLSIIFAIWFLINNNIDDLLNFDFKELIDSFKNPDLILSSIINITILFINLFIIILNLFGGYGLIVGALNTDAKYRYNASSISISLYIYGLFSFFYEIITLAVNEFSIDYIMNNYSISEILLIVVFIGAIIFGRVYSKQNKELNEDLLNGESYANMFKVIKVNIYVTSSFSILVALSLLFEKGFTSDLSLYVFILAMVLLIISTILESKHPLEEYTITKKKKS